MDADFDGTAITLGSRPTPPTRRTRGALNDLSRQLAGVTVTLLATPSTNNQMPSSMMTPSQSPDEMIIQLRGRKNPVTWSPLSINGVQKLAQYNITPTKDSITPTRVMLGLRSSPRKRLQLSDTKETATNTSPEKIRKNAQVGGKRQKLENSDIGYVGTDVTLEALNGLTRKQLINIIQNLASNNAEVKRDLESSLPEPDLQPAIDELCYLKKNIFKSLPSCRLSSKSDSAAYSKAAIHLASFKRYLTEYSKDLVDSGQWRSVVEFTFLAWACVKATPVWDNPQHNGIRKHCFKVLATACFKALQNIILDDDNRNYLKQRLERLRGDSEDIEECLNYVNR